MEEGKDNRSLLTVLLVSALGLGGYYAYTTWFAPTPPTPPSITELAPSTPEDVARRDERLAAAQTFRIDTPQYRAELSNLSGGLTHFRVLGARYVDPQTHEQLDMVSTEREEYAPLRVQLRDGRGAVIPEDAIWAGEQLSPTSVRFTWRGDGVKVVRKFEAGTGPYQLWSTLRVVNEGTAPRRMRLRMSTHHYVLAEHEGGGFFASRSPWMSNGLCLNASGVTRKDRKHLTEARHGYRGVRFVALENAYFAQALAVAQGEADFCGLHAEARGASGDPQQGTLFEGVLAYAPTTLEPGAEEVTRTLAYFGPKTPQDLARAGHGLVDVVDLGWLAIIARQLVELLAWIYSMTGNWGVAIILLTVLIKLISFPLELPNIRSMAGMRAIKPELDRLNELYADDAQTRGAATMELYRKHKINPFIGCLPQLLSLPIWWALYTSLSTNVELFHASFIPGWLGDLSARDPYFIMPLALGVLMFIQQKLMPSTVSDPVQARMMQWMMPIMITVFMLFLPAGLTVYMFTNSALRIVQQRVVEWRLSKLKPVAAATEAAPVVSAPEPAPAPADIKPRPLKAGRRARNG